MMRVVVPGNAVLVFDKPGPYMIYHEKKSTVDGRYYASDNVDGLSLGLTADETGAQVKLVEPRTSTSYTIGNRSGTSIYAFTLDQPGRYRLAANLAGGRADAKAVLAIDQGMVGTMLRHDLRRPRHFVRRPGRRWRHRVYGFVAALEGEAGGGRAEARYARGRRVSGASAPCIAERGRVSGRRVAGDSSSPKSQNDPSAAPRFASAPVGDDGVRQGQRGNR